MKKPSRWTQIVLVVSEFGF